MESLLEPDEKPAYALLNEAGTAPLLIACDHASNRIPRKLNGLGIDPDLYERHIAYDIGTRQVGKILMEMFDAPLLLSNYSRLVVDLNRHHDDPTMIAEISDNHIIAGNQGLSEVDRKQRLQKIFDPYHSTYSDLVDGLKKDSGDHSFYRSIVLQSNFRVFTDRGILACYGIKIKNSHYRCSLISQQSQLATSQRW